MSNDQMHIEVIDCGVARPEMIRILLAQPTWRISDWKEQAGLYFLSNESDAQKWIDRFLSLATAHTVDMLILPELSVPEVQLKSVQAWSKRTGAIVIAGSHYSMRASRYSARCPIIIAGDIHFVDKITPAPVEKSPIKGYGLNPGRSQIIFKNSSAGNFAILICSDYLDSTVKDNVCTHPLDLLCVPAFQSNSAIYHTRMGIDCEDSESGLYIAYSNSVCDSFGDGRSALFGQMDKMFIDKLVKAGATDRQPEWKLYEFKTGENYLVADLSLTIKKPYAKRTVHSEPNVQIIEVAGVLNSKSDTFGATIGRTDKRYTQIEDYYVPPREYSSICEILERTRMVFLIGDPGIGKTYTAVRLMKNYFNIGYAPLWFAGLEREDRLNQREILEQFRPTNRQVIYFEDPFGRLKFERRDSLRNVFGQLLDHLREVDARVVVSSRKEIFEQFVAETPSPAELYELKQELNVIKPSYSKSDLIQILENLASEATWFKEKKIQEIVKSEIEEGALTTPLSIRDFIYTSEQSNSIDIVLERLRKRRAEEKALFVEEICSASIETRLSLSLVFLFGTQPVARLAEWFNHVSAYLYPTKPWSGTSPFFRELRSQLGFRVEQYGIRAVVLRFSHPFYEEAFASAVEQDAVTFDLTTTLIKFVARSQLRSAIIGIVRLSLKHAKLSLRLLQSLVPVLKTVTNFTELVGVGFQFIRLNQIGGQEFFLVFKEAISLQELLKRINVETDIQLLEQALRLSSSYAHQDVQTEHQLLLDKQIDWSRIKSLWYSERNFSRVVPCLAVARQINASVVQAFCDTLSRDELMARFQSLKPPEQDVFYRAVSGSASLKHIRKLVEVKYEPFWRKSALLAREDGDDHKNRVLIDAGAWRALVKNYSLLPSGVLSVAGDFKVGEIISVFREDGVYVGAGIAAYNSTDMQSICGHHSSRIPELVTRYNGPAVIRDYNFIHARLTR